MATPKWKPISLSLSFGKPSQLLYRGKETRKRSFLEIQTACKLALLLDDILLPIVESLDKAEKARLTRTCRYFQRLVEPFLYRHIVIDVHDSSGFRSGLLHRTLMARPDLLPYILSYHGPFVPRFAMWPLSRDSLGRPPRWWRFRGNSPAPEEALTNEQRLERSNTIFSSAINLRDLHLTDLTTWIVHWDEHYNQASERLWNSFEALIPRLNLKKLVLQTSEDSEHVIRVLHALPELEHLELLQPAGPQLQRLQETDLPALRSLKVTLGDAALLVPGRPITKLELIPQSRWEINHEHQFTEYLVQQSTQSSSVITDFTMRLGRPWDDASVGSTFRLVTKCMDRIERLCLFVGGMMSLSTLLDTVPLFSSLRHLKLVGVVVRNDWHGNFDIMPGETDDLKHRLNKPDEGSDGLGLKFTSTICGHKDLDEISLKLKERCHALADVEWCHREKQECCLDCSV